MSDNFYRAFEDKHRGSRDLIKERLRVYLPTICPLAAMHPDLIALDLGCGRGEWLELLLENNISGQGVDQDDGMLAACRQRGLHVLKADAIAHLKEQPAQSLLAVTGFHIAEHLPFEQLQTLFNQARRTLAPGGLLILETPNPENLLVGAANFYIDPTHQRPLPTQLLIFLAEHHGFSSIKLIRLQEETRLLRNNVVSLYDVLANASPDYAIVAQLGDCSNPDLGQSTAMLLESTPNTGVSLHALASRYDANLQLNFEQLRSQLQANQQISQEAKLKAEEALRLGHQQLAQSAAQLTALYASQSWRITRPLRWLSRLLSRVAGRH